MAEEVAKILAGTQKKVFASGQVNASLGDAGLNELVAMEKAAPMVALKDTIDNLKMVSDLADTKKFSDSEIGALKGIVFGQAGLQVPGGLLGNFDIGPVELPPKVAPPAGLAITKETKTIAINGIKDVRLTGVDPGDLITAQYMNAILQALVDINNNVKLVAAAVQGMTVVTNVTLTGSVQAPPPPPPPVRPPPPPPSFPPSPPSPPNPQTVPPILPPGRPPIFEPVRVPPRIDTVADLIGHLGEAEKVPLITPAALLEAIPSPVEDPATKLGSLAVKEGSKPSEAVLVISETTGFKPTDFATIAVGDKVFAGDEVNVTKNAAGAFEVAVDLSKGKQIGDLTVAERGGFKPGLNGIQFGGKTTNLGGAAFGMRPGLGG